MVEQCHAMKFKMIARKDFLKFDSFIKVDDNKASTYYVLRNESKTEFPLK